MPPRKRINSRGMNLDLISNLPDNIIQSILAQLPIKDAVRTSLLSRNWRHKWTTLPVLKFDTNEDPALQRLDERSLVNIIYRVLCQHKGLIHEFHLNVRTLRSSYPDIDQWMIKFLSNKCLRLLEFEFRDRNRYKIHSSLFSCVNLEELYLFDCILPSTPPTFNGFSDLSVINFEDVTVTNESFETLITKCPQLVDLTLYYIDGLHRLKIDASPKLESLSLRGIVDGLYIDDAPKLEYLWFDDGGLNHICLKNAPSLSSANICFSQLPNTNMNLGNGRSISFTNNLNCLSNLRELEAGSYFLKFLARDSIRESLPSTFENLCKVDFKEVMLKDIDSLSSILCVIKSSPNLERFTVKPCRKTEPRAEEMKNAREYLEKESCSIGCFRKLIYVEIVDIMCMEPEMELIKLTLDNSPSLKEMVIEPNKKVSCDRVKESKIMKDLIQFRRASKSAEVIYKDGFQS